jgi:hydrogenase maturation protease
MPRILIVAYGNPLRSDDGLAWHVADALENKLFQSDVEILRLHQLGPELAETVSHFRSVFFVDAAVPIDDGVTAGEISIQEIPRAKIEEETASRFSHSLSPITVVALAMRLYGALPKLFSATIAGCNFDHGETLSPQVAAAVPRLVAGMESLINQTLFVEPLPPQAGKP